jgi:hypothetical protein
MMRAFMHFTLPDRKIVWQLALASLVSLVVYLAASAIYGRVGFPLDDSWIHQTYARNLALHGEWAFQPGKPSAGSTAPLWTMLLSIGFFLKLAPYIWTYLLGTLLLWGMGLLGEMVIRQINPKYQSRFPWVGLFLILEWHLVWSAASGMETLLHALLITTVLGMLMSGSRRFMTLGLLAGLSVWVRPDGITLLGPVAVYALAGRGPVLNVDEVPGKKRLRDLGLFLIGFASLFVPYLLFNLILAGTPMPNTFYAKQAEYAAWQARPFLERFGELSLQFLLGPSLALLPGAIGWLILSLRKRDWGTLVGMLWFAGYLFLYIERLPVYQHGRYIMPAMPIFFLWGLAAVVEFAQAKVFGRYHWLTTTGWSFFVGILCVAFWMVGANTYAQDVTLIETEMVASAKWVAKNIPQEEIIAAHDIGALGYFDSHELVDLAGLVSPEVIPFIRDEEKLAAFLDESGVAYLVAFPDFYPLLSQLAEPIYVAEGIGPELGGDNMIVYHWR